MVCPVNFVKKIIPILILVSLTVSVITIMSQHVTFALYFLPLNNTLINQEGENVTNRTIPAGPAPAPTNNQTRLALPAGPAPAPTNNQTRLALPAGPAPAPTNNQTRLALPAGPAPAPTNNQTRLALPPAPTNNPSLYYIIYRSYIQIQNILSVKSYKIRCAKSKHTKNYKYRT